MSNQRGAVNTSQGGGVKYMNVLRGKFSQRVSEGTEGAEPRELTKGVNAGKIVHEMQFTELTGRLIDIKKSIPSEYGVNWDIFLDVSTEAEPETTIKLSVGYSSSYIKRLFSSMPNLDLSEDITLKSFDIFDKEKNKTKYYVVPYQNGAKVLPFYNRDNPGDKPPMEQVTINGMPQWDSSKEMEFYEKELEKFIPLMNSDPTKAAPSSNEVLDNLKNVLDLEDDGDEMPF